ncbi:hypothetical protein M9H77_07881 [Catharanthus roseus]|uniref:Uncharacterized protein n=1 Tax=Catharanthus roseus TaxID=4058 RepID=A0ACC0BWI0_CATRO|nr:hypothetical protein M9H77_07881 [Catharanthus roseus]
MVSPLSFVLAFDIDHMLQCSSPCAYLEKQIIFSIARTKPSYYDLELLHDNLFFGLLVTNFSSSCASMWSKIHIFFGSFVETGYNETGLRVKKWLPKCVQFVQLARINQGNKLGGDKWLSPFVQALTANNRPLPAPLVKYDTYHAR